MTDTNARSLPTADELQQQTEAPAADDTTDAALELPPQPNQPAPPPAPFSLAAVTRTTARRSPPFVLIYGAEKRGKTTLACSFPNPFLILAGNERPPAHIDVATTPDPVATYEDLLSWLRMLAKEAHDFRTIVLDSASRIEPLVLDYVVRTFPNDKGQKVKHIEDYGFGKGYKIADKVWADLVKALSWVNKNKQMGVVLLAHATVKKIEEPLTPPFDSYILDMQQRAVDMLKREADAILFLRENLTVTEERDGMRKRSRGQGGKLIYAHTQASPAFTAGTRYQLPERILVEPEEGYESLAEAGFPRW